ncbi:hypothetical protein F4779DRAFT_568449 [Xylariaceae sp. FL0662B]|nr:hypothetical protein F4779DRAFT_568449 [Xylariaceae sp. FL0662B]
MVYELCHIFVPSIAQMVTTMSPTNSIGAAQVATGFIWLMVNTFKRPPAPPPPTPTGWRWFYNMSPYLALFCRMSAQTPRSPSSIRRPAAHRTCCEYAASFFASSLRRGYLIDASTTGDCTYCPYASRNRVYS